MAYKATALPHTADFETELFSLYPLLQRIQKDCWFKLINQSLIFNAPPGSMLQTLPGPYNHFLLLLEGRTRVYQVDENNREITFYRNYPGDICPQNLSSLFSSQQSAAYIQSETAIHALQISSRAFHQALAESDIFRHYIFSRMAQGLTELTQTVEQTVFKNLDSRLCLLLDRLFQQSQYKPLMITHQQLANEIGTTREVISRSLKALENNGRIKLGRSLISLTTEAKLISL
ncbi:MAG: Crp/Fnr family transcriptional regulator [Gammaproteobacteria bacterium]|nr:Crp/Fnr family transcriptional regulator [Gammaproteobacteria bacterium]